MSPEEVERRVNEAAGKLGRDLRMPGFRKGKVPAPVVIQRIGREAVLDEAVRAALPRWYLEAIDEAGIKPVGDPELDLGDLPDEGQPLTFTVEIGVRPAATLGDISKLEVGKREPEVDDEADRRADRGAARARRPPGDRRGGRRERRLRRHRLRGLHRRRGRRARLLRRRRGPRPAARARLRPAHPRLRGAARRAKAGDEKVVEVTFPEDYGSAPHLAGKPAQFEVTVNEVKPKQLPELDDDFATEAGGFDTLDELREDIATRCARPTSASSRPSSARPRSTRSSRAPTLDVPASLVDARAQELWEQMLHSLSHRGITKDAYLRIAQKTEDELLEEAKPDAEQALRREAVLAAVIEAEDIKPSDGDILDALQEAAIQQGTTPEKLRKRLEKPGPPGRADRGPRPAPGRRPAGRARGRHARGGRRRRVDAGVCPFGEPSKKARGSLNGQRHSRRRSPSSPAVAPAPAAA